MSARTLRAYVNETAVGTLEEVNGLWCFQYDEAWLKSPDSYALSPHLPLTSEPLRDGASRRHVQWYFDNLLPEEGQRGLLAADARLDVADAYGLLAWYGAESAGSLTLLPVGTSPGKVEPPQALSDAALEHRIQQLPTLPLAHAAVKRMSLAGARHKLAVILQSEQLFEPAGATVSTHILKPDHPDDRYRHTVINEWFVMRLAHRLGLTVPSVHRRYVPSPVYVIDRFDRTFGDSGWQRLHTIDACQLLGLDRLFKYAEGSMQTLVALVKACRSPVVTRSKLFAWLVFNVLVGNTDAHLKNLSFLVSHEGIQLAPFYDLLSVATYDTLSFDQPIWPERTELAWPLLGVRYFSDITRELLLDAGLVLGLSRPAAMRILDRLSQRIFPEAERLYAQVEAENAGLVLASPSLAARMGGESRCLRAIIHVIIKDMVRNLWFDN